MSVGKAIMNFIFQKGVETLLNECNWDIKDVRNNIIRELNIPKGTDISRQMKKIKNFVCRVTDASRKSPYVEELLSKLNSEV